MERVSINQFAKAHGYTKAEFLCEWHGFRCYEPIMTEGKVSFIGLPRMILIDKNDNIRMATPEEVDLYVNEVEE